MNKCVDCGHVFSDEEMAVWEESRGECFGFPTAETNCGCPNCRGDFVELFRCELCGEYVIEEQSEDFCGDCKKKTLQRFKKMLREQFSKEEIDLIADEWEGE